MPVVPTIFFDEGPGFVYIRTLGEGIQGSATLVRCMRDDKLYVRKEEFELRSDMKSRVEQERLEPQRALLVKSVNNVARCAGFCVYRHTHTGKGYVVSYWYYCDSGSLNGVLNRFQNGGTNIPEKWWFEWLGDMLDTLLSIHRLEVVHCDAHMGNWFVHNHGGEGPPCVVLGDWGFAKTRVEAAKGRYPWASDMGNDYAFLIKLFNRVLGMQRLPHKINNMVQTISDRCKIYNKTRDTDAFRAAMKSIRDKAYSSAKGSPRPTKRHQELVQGKLYRNCLAKVDLDAQAKHRKLRRFMSAGARNSDKHVYVYGNGPGSNRDYKLYVEGDWPQKHVDGRSVWKIIRS